MTPLGADRDGFHVKAKQRGWARFSSLPRGRVLSALFEFYHPTFAPMTMTIPTRLATYAFALLAFFALPACGGDDDEAPVVVDEQPMEPVAANDIVSAATENGMTTLVTAVQTAGLTETLQGEGPFTVFAPTNEAFDALPDGALDGLMAEEGHGEVSRVLTYHVVPGRIESSALAGTMTFDTVSGSTLTVTAGDDGVTVTDAMGNTYNVVTADVNVSNGVVHVIDGVLMPGAADDAADTM